MNLKFVMVAGLLITGCASTEYKNSPETNVLVLKNVGEAGDSDTPFTAAIYLQQFDRISREFRKGLPSGTISILDETAPLNSIGIFNSRGFQPALYDLVIGDESYVVAPAKLKTGSYIFTSISGPEEGSGKAVTTGCFNESTYAFTVTSGATNIIFVPPARGYSGKSMAEWNFDTTPEEENVLQLYGSTFKSHFEFENDAIIPEHAKATFSIKEKNWNRSARCIIDNTEKVILK